MAWESLVLTHQNGLLRTTLQYLLGKGHLCELAWVCVCVCVCYVQHTISLSLSLSLSLSSGLSAGIYATNGTKRLPLCSRRL